MVIAEAHLINPVSVPAGRWLPWIAALLAGGVMAALALWGYRRDEGTSYR